MRKSWLILFMFMVVTSLRAQQDAHYSQYVMNNYLLNPALGGLNYGIDTKLMHRQQWVGLEGAPSTSALTFHMSIDKYDPGYKHIKPLPHHGVGGLFLRDVLGPLKWYGVYGTYSYHIPLTEDIKLSVGGAMGVKQFVVDGTMIEFVQSETDDLLPPIIQRKFLPDGNLGLWVSGDRFFSGVSIQQVFGQRLNVENIQAVISQARLATHYFVHSGMKFPVHYDWHLVPSVMLRGVKGAPVQIDFNLKLNWVNHFWGGVSWRYQDAAVLLAGVHVNKEWAIGYSYDITTSSILSVSSGSHELVIQYRYRNKERHHSAVCPSSFWD